jgi:hypothetical protein
MNPDPAKFERVCRMLVLKRYEQPPPGYFDGFSSQVMARLRAGETAQETFWERLFGETPWFARWVGVFEAQPVLGGVLGAAFCVLLLIGVIQSERPGSGSINPTDPANVLQAAIPMADGPGLMQLVPSSLSISNGMVTAEPRGSLFNELRTSQTIPVDWRPNAGSAGTGFP